MVYAITQVVRDEKQVLVCAPSNAAVDLLTDKLSEQGLSVLRMGHPARVTERSLSKTLDAKIADHPSYRELRVLRKKMEQLKSTALKYKRNFGYSEKQERKLLLQESRALKADADLLEFYIVNDLLQSTQVICSRWWDPHIPCCVEKNFSPYLSTKRHKPSNQPCWIPILRSHRIIFAGDHQQLPPTIKSNEAAKLGLAKTLFEKGIERHPEMSVMLKVQYRMHQEIMKFSAEYFYDNALVADDSVKNETLTAEESPVEFIDTAGCGYNEAQDPETLSRFNEDEARLLIGVVEALVERIGADSWLDKNLSLGIITPYRAQVDYLHKLAESSAILEPLHALISINTVRCISRPGAGCHCN